MSTKHDDHRDRWRPQRSGCGLLSGARRASSPVVLERRPFVGGACVTETFAPGFRASTGAYVLSMLREAIWRDCRLAERGLVVDPLVLRCTASTTARICTSTTTSTSPRATLRQFSERDAAALARFEADLAEIAGLVTPMIDWTPPSDSLRSLGFEALARLGVHGFRHRREVLAAGQLFATSATQLLEQYFES